MKRWASYFESVAGHHAELSRYFSILVGPHQVRFDLQWTSRRVCLFGVENRFVATKETRCSNEGLWVVGVTLTSLGVKVCRASWSAQVDVSQALR